jgi:GH15 family glucan-1,4-alpha-glucosidase
MGYQAIENHGIIGDLHTTALVGMDGSIDFMCFPEFDSPTIFAALLDQKRGGRFQVAPVLQGAKQKQLYLPDTNILLTRFLSREGVAEVSDFMPVDESGGAHRLVRRAKTVRGEVSFRMVCEPRFDYSRAGHSVEKEGDDLLFVSRGHDGTVLRLRTSVPVMVRDGGVEGEFSLKTGQTAAFILEEARRAGESSAGDSAYVSRAFKTTADFWRRWASRSPYQGRWREMVTRSALILKLLISKPHGSMVAAPTFGLPEEIGGERNWDYRYTWIRDASFTLYGLIRLGYTEEAAAFMEWVKGRCTACSPEGTIQIMYGIDGRSELPEEMLPEMEGYMGSGPVRIGNNAYKQLQLDIYGELMDAVYLYDKYGEQVSYDLWERLVLMIDWVCANWQRPDEGIWEVRSGRKEYLYSRLMCWVAVDRGIRLALKRSLPGPLESWRKTRDTIHREIFETLWDPNRRAFVGHKGSTELDAACLLMPLVRLIGPTDPRWLSTLKAIEEELVDDSLVYRYRIQDESSDGLKGLEGTFNMCSFWYVECLARSGDLQKARFFFEKMLGYANHLGLYGEELGPHGEHLGNFPQAFTHLALISAATYLDRALSKEPIGGSR